MKKSGGGLKETGTPTEETGGEDSRSSQGLQELEVSLEKNIGEKEDGERRAKPNQGGNQGSVSGREPGRCVQHRRTR